MERHEAMRDPDYNLGRACCWPSCGEPIPNECVTPMCRPHSLEVGRAVYAQLRSEADRDERVKQAERATRWSENRRERRISGEHFVYYVRIEDYIKIGYTKSLRNRMRDFRVDTSTALLAIEPGSEPLERERHRQFTAERVHARRENFHPSDRLLAHIDSLRTQHALPVWALQPDTRAVTIRATP